MPVQYEYDRTRTPVRKTSDSSSLAEVLDVILDKGIVIEAWVRISVLGLELLTIEARVVVASVETYLRYAEAIGLTPLPRPRPGSRLHLVDSHPRRTRFYAISSIIRKGFSSESCRRTSTPHAGNWPTS